MSEARSKIDAVAGEKRLKNAIILFVTNRYLFYIFLHTQPLSNIFHPLPASLSPQSQFVLSNARAESVKLIPPSNSRALLSVTQEVDSSKRRSL
jgi:hypothetical protein